MAVTREDLDTIKSELDDRYMLQSDCNEIQTNVTRKFANDDKRLELINHDVGFFKKMGWIAITALIGEFAVSFLTLLKGV